VILSSITDPIVMLRTYEGILQGDRIRWGETTCLPRVGRFACT